MKSLQGILTGGDLDRVGRSVRLRFKDSAEFKTPEALIVYEQGILDEGKLLECLEQEYGFMLETPPISYMPMDIINHFSNFDCVPFSYDTIKEEIHVGVLPEKIKQFIAPYKYTKVILHKVPIYYFVKHYSAMYGEPKFLYPLPVKDIFDFIVGEAVDLGAADITIVQREREPALYYNVKKQKVVGKRGITRGNISDLVSYISSKAGTPEIINSKRVKYMSLDLDAHHRGRVCINPVMFGKSISIRVLPKETVDGTLEELNLSSKTCEFIRNKFMTLSPGLKLMVGPTMSGKNTTIAVGLTEMMRDDTFKAVSVEMPVELLIRNVEQINAETEEEYADASHSLIRQNPDVTYFTEMTDITAPYALEMSNTGKPVISSIHANSLAEVLTRMQDLTKLSLDRIILNLSALVFQNLVIAGNELRPVNRCIEITEELRKKLLGKSIGEIYLVLREEESAWES